VAKSTLILIAAGALILACEAGTSTAAKSGDPPALSSTVTPVQGPSWLKHLGVAMWNTRMGQMGGDRIAPLPAHREPELWQYPPAQAMKQKFELTGADLYRINCRSCHGPEAKGAPPEIHSLIGPVQGTSAALIERRMEARRAPIGKEMAEQMAGQAEKAIRDRLHNGGQKMPAFSYLRPEEIAALLSYLDRLAGVPAKPHAAVSVSAAPLGEEVVKGTCHTCHDATGPGGGGMMGMMRGVPPSLASLPYEYSLNWVMRQVHFGSSGMMMMGGTRMPPFPYFTQPEIAAAYIYLRAYPPQR
jgi:mono/diheme cytochrome c family protein